MAEIKKDEVTGTDDTGHVWDGIRELNTPLPRWWLYGFYMTIIWAIGYWIVMPAWPMVSDYTRGMLGYDRRALLASELKEARQIRDVKMDKLLTMQPEAIIADTDAMRFAMNGGRILFAENCAACHGTAAAGQVGYPNLLDDDWLWDGTYAGIEQTIKFGIRASHPDTRVNDMPAWKDVISEQEIDGLADWLSKGGTPSAEVKQVFADNCAACHGDDGKGMGELGGPNLIDGIWLYGGDKATIVKTIAAGRKGVMPSWQGRLSDGQIRLLTTYVYGLGGGHQ